MRTISTSVSNADSAYVHWQKQLEPAVTHWGGRCYETGTRGVTSWGTQRVPVMSTQVTPHRGIAVDVCSNHPTLLWQINPT